MSKFLNSVALLPMLGWLLTAVYIFIVKEEFYTNYHWMIVAVLSLQANAKRLENVNSVSVMIYVSGILANILLLVASGFDLKITPATLVLFTGYLSVGLLIASGNMAMNWQKQLSANKSLKSDS